MGLENLEQPVHVFGGLLRLLFEIQFVAAGTERRRGRVFQPFDGFSFLLVNVDQLLVKNAENAVDAPIDFLNALVPPRFLNHPGQARIDHGGRPARLRHQKISNQFRHKIIKAGLK